MDLIEKVIEVCKTSTPPHFATFDFDGTVIENDCAEATLTYMARKGTSMTSQKDFHHYYALLESGDAPAAYRFGASTLRGLSIKAVETIVQRAMRSEGNVIAKRKLFGRTVARGISPRWKVVDIIHRLQVRKVSVWIVSASPECVVRSAMEYFGLSANLIGVRNIVEDGLITEKIQEPMSIFGGKVDCIKKYIHPTTRPVLGIGDSMNDYPMLEYSQVRAVVDRRNELSAKARANQWHIL